MIRNKDIQEALDRLEGDNKDKVLIEHYIQGLERSCYGMKATIANFREKEAKTYGRYSWRRD